MKKVINIPIWYEKNRIIELRKEAGYNQTQVSEKIGCVLKTYQNYEQGHNYPTLEYANNLANLYNVSIDYLLGRSDCRNIKDSYISEKTGLNDNAIQTLKSLKSTYDFEHTMNILNFIMTDTYLFGSFLGYLRDYIEPNYTIPIHPERDKDTGNISYIENLDIESDSILTNKERLVYLGKKSGEFDGKPLYDTKGIPIENLSRMNLLLLEEIFKTWKDQYNARK